MKIITIPHPALRQTAQEVTRVDKKLHQFLAELSDTLEKKRRPKGVGLAAPQVNVLWRVFATQLLEDIDKDTRRENAPPPSILKLYINPEIINHSENFTLGPNPEEPTLEGCLSIPGLYGPVPRWEWVELKYQTLVDDKLVDQNHRFAEFAARVIQHEFDHLNGVLFIDHILKYQLPLYREDEDKKLVEIEPEVVAGLVQHTRS